MNSTKQIAACIAALVCIVAVFILAGCTESNAANDEVSVSSGVKAPASASESELTSSLAKEIEENKEKLKEIHRLSDADWVNGLWKDWWMGYKLFDADMVVKAADGREITVPISTVGIPHLHVRPMAHLVLADYHDQSQVPSILRDVVIREKPWKCNLWMVPGDKAKIVRFKTVLYTLPGARMPSQNLDPIYSGLRTRDIRTTRIMPYFDSVSSFVNDDFFIVRVTLVFAVPWGDFLREMVDIYNPYTGLWEPVHVFDFIYDPADEGVPENPEEIILKVWPDSSLSAALRNDIDAGKNYPGQFGKSFVYRVNAHNKLPEVSMPGWNFIIDDVSVEEHPEIELMTPNSVTFVNDKTAVVSVAIMNVELSERNIPIDDREVIDGLFSIY